MDSIDSSQPLGKSSSPRTDGRICMFPCSMDEFYGSVALQLCLATCRIVRFVSLWSPCNRYAVRIRCKNRGHLVIMPYYLLLRLKQHCTSQNFELLCYVVSLTQISSSCISKLPIYQDLSLNLILISEKWSVCRLPYDMNQSVTWPISRPCLYFPRFLRLIVGVSGVMATAGYRTQRTAPA